MEPTSRETVRTVAESRKSTTSQQMRDSNSNAESSNFICTGVPLIGDRWHVMVWFVLLVSILTVAEVWSKTPPKCIPRNKWREGLTACTPACYSQALYNLRVSRPLVSIYRVGQRPIALVSWAFGHSVEEIIGISPPMPRATVAPPRIQVPSDRTGFSFDHGHWRWSSLENVLAKTGCVRLSRNKAHVLFLLNHVADP